MKALSIALLVTVSSILPLFGQPTPAFQLDSPDTPAAWYDRSWEQVFQELSWNKSRQELSVYVAYSNDPVIHQRDLLSYDSFTLSFPTVRLDASTRILYFTTEHGRRIAIGHLNSGLFGAKVVLNPGVEVVARSDGRVMRATLQSNSL